MPLSIRNPKVEKLARQKAAERNITVTAVIGEALSLLPPPSRVGIAKRLREIADALARDTPGRGRKLTKDEINAEWMD